MAMTPTRPEATQTIGLSGLKHSAGYINEEFLSDLNSLKKRTRVYNEMRRNSPVVAGTLSAIELTLRGVEWRIDGEEDDPRTEFITGAWGDMAHSWNDHVSQALTMLPFGFAPFEIVYKRRRGERGAAPSKFEDGRIGWDKLAFRSQDSIERWLFDDRSTWTGLIQRTYPDYIAREIPRRKLIVYRTTTEKENPEGVSVLRPAYVPYYYAKNLQAIEAIGAERDLAGLPVLYLPATHSDDDIAEAKRIVRRVRQDEQAGVVMPSSKNDPDGWSFELLGSPGSKQFNVGDIITRHEKRIAMTTLAQFIMLGMDQVGAYSLSSDQSDFFLMAMAAYAGIIAETFNQYAIDPLLRLNGFSTADAPRLAHGPLGKPDLDSLSNYFSRLGMLGFTQPDGDMEVWLRDLVNAPPVDPNREIQTPPAPQQDAGLMSVFQSDGSLKWRHDQPLANEGQVEPISERDIDAAARLLERAGIDRDAIEEMKRVELEIAS